MEKTNIEEYLKKNGKLTYANKGVSMMPLLKQGRDLFTIEKKTNQRCKKNDVVLYKRGEDYVLHRIIEVRPQDYVILGDNCIRKEYGTTDKDILGVMTSFKHNGKDYSVQDWQYRLYTFIISHTISVRILIKKMKSRVKNIKILKNIKKLLRNY